MLSPSMANKLYILEVEMLKLTVFLYLLSIERTSLSVPHCVSSTYSGEVIVIMLIH